MAGHLEHELKYDADADFTVPDLRAAEGCADVGGAVTHTLLACYDDTEDLRMAAHGIALRRRTGGGDAGWHVKMPAAENTKLEIHAPLADTPPSSLTDLLAAYVRGAPLVPIAELETHRTERPLLAEDGRVLAELADDAAGGRLRGRGAPLEWREVEVEAVDGPPEFLEAAGELLLASGARPAGASFEARAGAGRGPETRRAAIRPARRHRRRGAGRLPRRARRAAAADDPAVRLAYPTTTTTRCTRCGWRRAGSAACCVHTGGCWSGDAPGGAGRSS